MELTLSDEQEFFRDTTHRFLATECPLTQVRALAGDERGFDPGYWRQGAELGWTSLLVPDDLGGGSISGVGLMDATLVADGFGRFVSPGPLAPVNVVAAAIALAGTDAQRDQHLPGLMVGDTVAAWCGAPHAWGKGSLIAEADGAGFVLNGRSEPVEAGAEADLLLVTANGGAGLVQVLVPADTPGITITSLTGVDLVRRFARVEFDALSLGEDARVGSRDTASRDIEWQWQIALALQAAEMVGAAQRVFDFTLEWTFDRYSFGRPLASYQELKHRFADMKMWLETSHALTSALAREAGARAPGAAETASATKAYLGQYLTTLAHDCVQIHGGIGLTADHDIHLYLRRITSDRATYGTPAEHRQRIGRMAA